MDVALALTIAGVMVIVGGAMAGRERRRRVAIFETVAKQEGPDAYVTPGGWASNPELTLYRGKIKVHVTVWSTKHGRYTQWTAYALRPSIASFEVYRETLVSGIGKAIGLTIDIETGTREFDEHFNVKAHDEGIARRLWTRERAMHMYGRYSTSRLTADTLMVRLERPELAVNEADVLDGVDFIVGIAAADLFGADALRTLPEVTFHDETLPYIVVPGPGGIRIGPVAGAHGTSTWARASAALEEELAIDVTDGDAVAMLPAAARPYAKQLGRARIVFDGAEVSIRWPGIETDIEHLTAGIELLRALTQAPSQGVFR